MSERHVSIGMTPTEDTTRIPMYLDVSRIVEAVSPHVTLTQTDDGVVITVEDIDGTKIATVYNGPEGPTGVGVPAGGTAGQVLSKASGTDYDTEWVDPIDVDQYAKKRDTVLDTTLSRGRKENSTVGDGSVAFGGGVEASGDFSQAAGWNAAAKGGYSHAEGVNTQAIGVSSHAEGSATKTTFPATAAHAEGSDTLANGYAAHAEGEGTQADGYVSHAEGYYTIAKGYHTRVSGQYNVADNYAAWPEWEPGKTYAVGDRVKRTTTPGGVTTVTGLICRTANSDTSFTQSKWRIAANGVYADTVGNGTADNARSNAYALDWDGSGHYAGDVYVHANDDSTGGVKLATIEDLPPARLSDRVAPLNGSALSVDNTIDVDGVPEYVADVSEYSDYGITEPGWYVFARITAKDGVSVTAQTTVTGADGYIMTVGGTHIDVAARFEVAAMAKRVTVTWGGEAETFVFRATDLAVRNLDYRTTFYLFDLSAFVTWSYALTTDATFATGKRYFTLVDGEYVEAVEGVDWTAGDAVPADTYYKHSKLHIEGMTRNVTYKLDQIVDCPIEIALPVVADDGYGAWYEFQLRYDGSYSCTLLPPEGVKIGTVSTQNQTAGINVIDLQYTGVGGVQMWSLLNTHSNIPA